MSFENRSGLSLRVQGAFPAPARLAITRTVVGETLELGLAGDLDIGSVPRLEPKWSAVRSS